MLLNTLKCSIILNVVKHFKTLNGLYSRIGGSLLRCNGAQKARAMKKRPVPKARRQKLRQIKEVKLGLEERNENHTCHWSILIN